MSDLDKFLNEFEDELDNRDKIEDKKSNLFDDIIKNLISELNKGSRNNQIVILKVDKFKDTFNYEGVNCYHNARRVLKCLVEDVLHLKDIEEDNLVFAKIIDEKEYIDSYKPIKCVCKRGHIVGIRYSYFIKGQSGCKKCADLENSGNSHWNYNDGRSLVIEALRHSVKSWKKEIKEIYGNKCPITGETSYLVVHHLTSFG